MIARRPTSISSRRTMLRHLLGAVESAPQLRPVGSVVRVVGTTVEAAGLQVQLGSICWIDGNVFI